ncbi:MAG: tape measure protein [Psychrobacter sp.]|uniref:phage tail tape measure C-terminal domain-containing protein n=1 Tax=Psychrobacter sp. TaxID=56811 RepID=UPI002648397F|nr:phage tail tape measure C-terminal domain-containing protein [Psychrobacter sp.]MDN5619231.1 tape measure protein [Psychrobacter sp.]
MSQELRFGLVISADGTAAIRTLDDLDNGLDDLNRSSRRADRSTSSLQQRVRGFGGTLAGVAKKAVMFGGVVGTLAGALSLNSLIDTQRQFDILNSQLITATGGTKQAAAAFDELTKFASTTPYALEQSVQGFVQLKNLGLDPSMRSMQSYGNFAAGMGKDLNQMIEAVADASTFEFERLKEFGIKASQQGDQVSFTFQGVTTTVAKNSKEIQEYLLAIGENKFGDAMANRAKTLDGAISNLGDNFNSFKLAVVQSGIGDAIKDIVVRSADGLSRMTDALKTPENAAKLKSTIATIAEAFGNLQGFVSQATGGIGRVMDALNTPENAERLQTALQAVGDGFSRLKDLAGQTGEVIGQVTDYFVANQEIIIPLASGIGAAAGAFLLFNGAIAAWTAIGTLATAVTAGFGAAVALVTSPVTLTLAAITGLVAVGVLLYRNWDTIKAKATEVFNSLPAPVQDAFANIKEIFTTVKDWAVAAFDFLAPNVKVTMDLVSAVFTAGWATIKGIFTTSFDVIKNIVSTSFNVIKAIFGTSINVIATVFNTGFDLVKNTIKTAFNAIKALARGDIAGFVSIIGGGLKNAVSIVTGGVANIAKAFGGLASKLYNIGIDAVQGLINGVKAKITGAISVAKNLASSVSDTVKNFFVIRSPSRLFKKFGEWLSIGLGLGIKAKESEAVRAALNLAQNVSNTMAGLKKDIALFGNNSQLAAFDYDRENGAFPGIKDSVLDELREYYRIKEDLIAQDKESQKWLMARGQLLDKAAQAQTNETNSLARFASNQQSRLADYEFETSLIGKKASEVERLRFEYDLLNQAEWIKQSLSEKGKQLLDQEVAQTMALRDAQVSLREQQQALKDNDWVGGMQSGFQSLVDGAQSLNETMTQATTGAFNKMGDSLAAFVTTGKLNFKDLAGSILQDISKMLIQFAMLRLAKAAVGMFADGGAFGSSGLLALAKGGAFNTHSIQYYANGDVFNKPTAFRHAGGLGVMGEAGPEAVMPLTRGPNGKLGVQVFGNQQSSQSAGVVNQVQIDVHISNEGTSTDVQTSSQDGKQLANSLKAVVLQTLQEQMRPGNMLAAR